MPLYPPVRCRSSTPRRKIPVAPVSGPFHTCASLRWASRRCEPPAPRNGMQGGYKRLVAPIAGSAADDRVLGMVAELLGKEGGSVTFLYVVQVPQSMPLDAELPAEVEAGEHALRRAVS